MTEIQNCATVPAQPVDHVGEIPVYADRQAPPGLMTVSQLAAQRRKPAPDQTPAAYLRTRYWGDTIPLYNPDHTVKMRPLSALQRRQMEARRTCPACGTIRDQPVHDRCLDCRKQAEQDRQDRQARTCWSCRRIAAEPYTSDDDYRCLPCRIARALRAQAVQERRDIWARTCPGCTLVTATDNEIAEHIATHGSWTPRRCPPCEERRVRELADLAERQKRWEQEAQQARENELHRLRDWAADALTDSSVLILDTETTGLDDTARIVEIAAITTRGETVIDTLLNPGEPIPTAASDIHGITDTLVQTAPTFGDLLAQLTTALTGKRVLIYNQPYDVARLRHELTLHYLDQAARTAAYAVAAAGSVPAGLREQALADAREQAEAWLASMTFEDVMVPYSDWIGDFDEYCGNNRWQPLNGGHRAAGDCRAVIRCLSAMSRDDD
ncbi:exonuclease domain-containing protein [Streptomyces sp. cg36]|uniref:exonuclease domain-containing protein n=1 Tax=Streptomyces sp. cg36 TaxID=3238798 RepID=UPI0034E1D34D